VCVGHGFDALLLLLLVESEEFSLELVFPEEAERLILANDSYADVLEGELDFAFAGLERFESVQNQIFWRAYACSSR
jgi:hypothetical protein